MLQVFEVTSKCPAIDCGEVTCSETCLYNVSDVCGYPIPGGSDVRGSKLPCKYKAILPYIYKANVPYIYKAILPYIYKAILPYTALDPHDRHFTGP